MYEKVPHGQAMETTGKNPIGVKWVGVLKTSGRHRSRLVAKEVSNGGDPDVCAKAPALEGKKISWSRSAAGEHMRRSRKTEGVVLVHAEVHAEVHRAFLNTSADGPKQCGKLLKRCTGRGARPSHGSRDWHGSRAYFPSAFRRRGCAAAAHAHGDDSLMAGRRSIAEEMKRALDQRWQIESVVMSPRRGDAEMTQRSSPVSIGRQVGARTASGSARIPRTRRYSSRVG